MITKSVSTNTNIKKNLNLKAMSKVMDSFQKEESQSNNEDQIAKAKVEVKEEPKKEEPKKEEPKKEIVVSTPTVDASGYLNNPDKGFIITTGNKTYELSEDDFYIVASVIGCEGAGVNDMLGVASVIFNRADNYGISPKDVVSARGQFSCYHHLSNSAANKGASVLSTVNSGIRNNKFTSFNGRYSNLSNNYIEINGNRYR
jgi:hypothetical protein